jgi:hypothetical protein
VRVSAFGDSGSAPVGARSPDRVSCRRPQVSCFLETYGQAGGAEWIPRFLERVASQVVVGVYRATRTAPAQMFYAHAAHAHEAAHIVLADSMFQEQRGFPLLIDLAHHLCAAVFGGSLRYLTETAYAAVGEPWRYFSERTTRGN